MCGRFALKSSPARIASAFGLDECAEFGPRYNIPPTTDIPAIRRSPEGKRVLHLLRWGLVPHWAKDLAMGAKMNNARGESVAEKPAFRDAFKRRRCLIPADGFYEWKTEGKLKLPYYISLKSEEPMAMAGLWESWTSQDGEIVRTCCIITTGPNAVMEPIHDRMPVIIPTADYETWLSAPAAEAGPLIHPCPAKLIQAWPVDRRVSNARVDDPQLIDPIPA